MKYGALILAAGCSSRLGRPKQLVHLNGETLLERSIRIAKAASCEPVVVVLGAFEDLIRHQCDLQEVNIISNPEWSAGMGSSLSLGVCLFENVRGVVVMTCDMPAVTAEHLSLLASSGNLTASSYAGRKGVPAYFPCDLFSQLARTNGETGAKRLLQSAMTIELIEGELDIDTPEDLAQAETNVMSSLHS